MALHCLALLGSKNEPLYLCDGSPKKDVDVDGTLPGDEDIFGFSEVTSTRSGSRTRSASIRHEVRSYNTFVFDGRKFRRSPVIY
jgi:hypothetical protein